jgi:hypothetical protein
LQVRRPWTQLTEDEKKKKPLHRRMFVPSSTVPCSLWLAPCYHVPNLRTCVLFEVSEIKNYFGPWENWGIWKVTREWKNQRSVHGTLFSVIGTDVPEL